MVKSHHHFPFPAMGTIWELVKTGGGLLVLNSKWRGEGEGEAGVVIAGGGGGTLKAVPIGNSTQLMKGGSSFLKIALADSTTGSSPNQTCLADPTTGQCISPSSDQGNGMFPDMRVQTGDQVIGKTRWRALGCGRSQKIGESVTNSTQGRKMLRV